MAGRNYLNRHEFNGILGKRLVAGLKEFHRSTHEERQEVLKIWKEKGFQAELKQRGELNEAGGFTCPLHCDVDQPHKHYVDGDADIHGLD